jgi:hypothetical protein
MSFNMNNAKLHDMIIATCRIKVCPMCGMGANDPVWYPARKRFLWIKERKEGLYIKCWKCHAVSEITPLYKILEEV